MVNDGGCPFMFDGALSFDRVLMPASQASTAWSGLPLPPLTRSPSPCKQGEASFGERGPLPPRAGGGKGLGNAVPLPLQAGGGKFWGTWLPSPCKRGEARFWERGSPHRPASLRKARFWVNRPSPPCFSCPPPLRGWVASGARRKGAAGF